MGIADVSKALTQGGGDVVAFRRVRLGYKAGGKEQVLKFEFKAPSGGFVASEREFPGDLNPNEFALSVGQDLRAAFEKKSDNA